MAVRLGKQTIAMSRDISIVNTATIVGTKESEGPLSPYFDVHMNDAEWNEKTWEKTESKMQKEAAKLAIRKAGKRPEDIDCAFAGDLLNQCISSGFSARELEIPYYGLYGACSTMIEGLSLGAITIDGGGASCTIAVASSHFCTAERQYRNPLEYGGQRPPTAQWTVTGAGAAVLECGEKPPYITHITTGKVVDFGVIDQNNMGGAMAPAAIDTLCAHFNDTGRTPQSYDLILTGDLGKVGREIVINMMNSNGFNMSDNYGDTGCMIYNFDEQDVHAGGSGCGCVAVTTCGYVFEMLKRGELNDVLILGTGALLSPTSTLQGESVPGIAHAVALSNKPVSRHGGESNAIY